MSKKPTQHELENALKKLKISGIIDQEKLKKHYIRLAK